MLAPHYTHRTATGGDNVEPRCLFVSYSTREELRAANNTYASKLKEPAFAQLRDVGIYIWSDSTKQFHFVFNSGLTSFIIDATALDDAHNALRVYGAVFYGAYLWHGVKLRVRPSNAAIKRSFLDSHDDVRTYSAVKRFIYVDLICRDGAVTVNTALVMRPRLDLVDSLREMHAYDGALLRDPAHPFKALVDHYHRFTIPRAALLMFVKTVGDRDVLNCVTRTLTGFEYWRRSSGNPLCTLTDAAGIDVWNIICVSGPAATRDAVCAALQDCVPTFVSRSVPPDHQSHVHVRRESLVHVVHHKAPIEREYNVKRIAKAFSLHCAGLVQPRGYKYTLTNRELVTYYSAVDPPKIPAGTDFVRNIDEFFAGSVEAHLLQPLACSHYRWSYQHEVCREMAMVLLDAHRSEAYGGMLPIYIVLDIFDWTDAEFVWRSTEMQRVNLIIGVSKSMRRVREQRDADKRKDASE